MNKYAVERSGYTILDLLSDIGGIEAILFSFFAVIISVFNYKNFANTLASKFYKIKVAKKADLISKKIDNLRKEKLKIPSKF